MNKVIFEFAIQAKGYAGFDDASLEQFAKLLIEHCSYLADEAHYKAGAGQTAGGYIREQFK